MSICRFSPNSEVYAYETNTCFVVHVSYYRLIGDTEPPEISDYNDINGLVEYYQKVQEWYDKAKRVLIDKPYAGETFYFDTFEECIKFLAELKELGYKVPDSVFKENS